VAFQHFARHLRISWLVCSDQPELPQAIEKQECTETREQQRVGTGTIRHADEIPGSAGIGAALPGASQSTIKNRQSTIPGRDTLISLLYGSTAPQILQNLLERMG
jgi:hypothetical protein